MSIVNLNDENFENEVLRSDKPVLVDFWAQWCGPCKMLSPVIEEIAEEYDGKIKVAKCNIDEEMQLAVQYGISSIPTILLFENGEIVKKSIGFAPKESLIEELGL